MMKLPEKRKKKKIGISIDFELNEKLEKETIEGEFYKKSRTINHIIKEYFKNKNK